MTLEARKKRFLKNVVGNPSRGQGELWRRNTYKYPTTQQMDQFKKYHVIYDIDPALRKVIIDLNSKGYRTGGSCQGHLKVNGRGYIKINTSRNQLPERFRNRDTPLARMLSDNLSLKDIDPNEVKTILKKHNIIVTSYTNPFYPKDEVNGRFSNQYVFFFPVILDTYPRESIAYYYISNGNLETSLTPKKDSVKLVQLRDSNGNYTGFKLIKNGKLIWKKELSTRRQGATIATVREIQQATHRALGSKFDIEKFKAEVRKTKTS
jgi:hypothetical protein